MNKSAAVVYSTDSFNSKRRVTLTFSKEYLKFSAAHFTVFSATERERLHGHNFTVSAELDVIVGENGFASNYRVYKDELKRCCAELDEYLLLPGNSPYLNVSENDAFIYATFDGEEMQFLKSDTKVLPIQNTTVEEFSFYILQQLLNTDVFSDSSVKAMSVSVASGPGQEGKSYWHDGDD